MIYLTDVGDNLQSLIEKYYDVHTPEAIAAHIRRIKEYNRFSFAFAKQTDDNAMLRPFHLLWLPYEEGIEDESMRYNYETICSDTNVLSADDRMKLKSMIDSGINLKQVAATCHMREILSHSNPIHGQESAMLDGITEKLGAVGMTTAILGNSAGYTTESVERFQGQLRNITALSKKFVLAKNPEKKAIRLEIKSAYENMHHDYGKTIKRLEPPPDGAHKPHLLYSSRRLLKTAVAKEDGIELLDAHEMKMVFRTLKYTRVLGRSLIAIDLASTGIEVWDDLEHGKKKEAAEAVGGLLVGMGGAYGATIIVGVIAGPVGWIGLIGAVGLGMFMGWGGRKVGSYIADKIWDAEHVEN